MEIAKILSLKIRDKEYSVEFKKSFGVICPGLLPETGSAMMVAEAIWPYAESVFIENESINSYLGVGKISTKTDIYNALSEGFKSWNNLQKQ